MLDNQCSSENLKDEERKTVEYQLPNSNSPPTTPTAHPIAGLKAMSVSFILHTNILQLYFLNHLHIFIQRKINFRMEPWDHGTLKKKKISLVISYWRQGKRLRGHLRHFWGECVSWQNSCSPSPWGGGTGEEGRQRFKVKLNPLFVGDLARWQFLNWLSRRAGSILTRRSF